VLLSTYHASPVTWGDGAGLCVPLDLMIGHAMLILYIRPVWRMLPARQERAAPDPAEVQVAGATP